MDVLSEDVFSGDVLALTRRNRAYADRRGHLVRSWYGYQFANLVTPTSDKQTPHC